MSRVKGLTPMMAQYRQVKSSLPSDVLLLFRLGDFYEFFFDDAEVGARILNVALTKRGTTPMCGIPFHAAGSYLRRILKAGRKVAICEQIGAVRPGKLVHREVTEILSPGTHFDGRMLHDGENNFLAAISQVRDAYGLALVDLTTGEFLVTELRSPGGLAGELSRSNPSEVLMPSQAAGLKEWAFRPGTVVTEYEDAAFQPDRARLAVQDHFQVSSLAGLGLADRPAAVGAAGAALHYLSEGLRRDLKHLTRISFFQTNQFLVLDETSLRHLEVLEPLRGRRSEARSLFDALNRTKTPMGARRLRDWLSRPLCDSGLIQERQTAVQAGCDRPLDLECLRERLGAVRDLERTVNRLSVGTGNGRDLVTLKTGLEAMVPVKETLRLLMQPTRDGRDAFAASHEASSPRAAPSRLADIDGHLHELPDLTRLIARAILEEPPATVKEGHLIRDGFDAVLDELRQASREGKKWIARLQEQEIERTGIASLKVRFNSVFGYFIEVTRSNLGKVPAEYRRKQTIASGERFVTEELKRVENKILGAEERAVQREYDLFLKIREAVIEALGAIQETATALGELDVLTTFAETARLYDYCRPEVGREGVIEIHDGRHPVLERGLTEERFVPNDVALTPDQRVLLVTGPNMAGKSTYIRQVALLVLMAHAGSFVPASTARIDLADRIFTRIGASDDLAGGQSTFMVEMTETANILNNATEESLVILDEIGRGTSTFDGLSLAWSIVEQLHHRMGTKTLFATHYHELTELASRLPRVRNYNVAVKESGDQIVFLRKIVPGASDKSYGIQVARLAGVPREVIARAREILQNLEATELTPEGRPRGSRRRSIERKKLRELSPIQQMDLFAG